MVVVVLVLSAGAGVAVVSAGAGGVVVDVVSAGAGAAAGGVASAGAGAGVVVVVVDVLAVSSFLPQAVSEMASNDATSRVFFMVPSLDGLANLTLALLGKTTVNLNFSLGKAAMEQALKQAEIGHIITARTVLKKLKLEH